MLASLAQLLIPMTETTVVETSGTFPTVLAWLLIIAYLAFIVSAYVSVIKSPNYSSGMKALWFLAIMITPFIGAIVWFVWGRKG